MLLQRHNNDNIKNDALKWSGNWNLIIYNSKIWFVLLYNLKHQITFS